MMGSVFCIIDWIWYPDRPTEKATARPNLYFLVGGIIGDQVEHGHSKNQQMKYFLRDR
jgi:ribosome biogenesis SPOUT family RNA methylase Rps3